MINNITDLENWIKIEEGDDPSEGLYIALFEDDENKNSLICNLLEFGEYEIPYKYEKKYGWSEYVVVNSDEYYVYPRKVIAYLPINFDLPSLKSVRDHFSKGLK